MMHSKMGEDKKKKGSSILPAFLYFLLWQAKLLRSPSSTNEYLYKPTESPFTKRKEKGAYNHGEFVDKNSTQ
jgi:hypothetical protein